MATEKVTEPAKAPDAEVVTEPNPAGRVYVYDTNSKQKLPYPVPRTWLDGRFPNLKEQPSKKAGN